MPHRYSKDAIEVITEQTNYQIELIQAGLKHRLEKRDVHKKYNASRWTIRGIDREITRMQRAIDEKQEWLAELLANRAD